MSKPVTPRRVWEVVAVVCVPVILWALAILLLEPVRFSVLSSRTQIGEEGASAFARLFGALVLVLFADDATQARLRRIAAGLVVLGLGGLAFGTLPPLLGIEPGLPRLMYASLVISALACGLFLLGFWPDASTTTAVKVLAVATTAGTAVIAAANSLPTLADPTAFYAAIGRDDPPIGALTSWHWVFSSLLVLSSGAAMAAGALRYRRDGWGGWLVVAMGLFAGSQLHNAFWPSAYTSTLTSANVLRLGFAASVAIGGLLELRRVAAERAALLDDARDHAARLAELTVLKADFTAMAAHELTAPVTAVRRYAEILAMADPRPDQAAHIHSILVEVDHLTALISDVRTSAAVERDDFVIDARRVSVGCLVKDATEFATTFAGSHALVVEGDSDMDVVADPDRIGQVLRNLLSNAASYAPPNTTITVRTRRVGGSVVFEVADEGDGIRPEDLPRIFEKFARGRHSRVAGGLGLGLYLSRRIVQAHGGELTVASPPGEGAVFAFSLEMAR